MSNNNNNINKIQNNNINNNSSIHNNSFQTNNQNNNLNNNNQIENLIENRKEIFIYYNFFIFTDTGSCIFKISSDEKDKNSFQNIGAMQGIIQALFFTAIDLKCHIHSLNTELGILCYKAFTNNENTLLLALMFPNYYCDENLCLNITQNILDYVYHILLIHIGVTDLFSFSNSNDIEKLRRYLDLYKNSIKYILNHHTKLNLILKAEKKYEFDKDVIYSIKFYLEKIKKNLKLDLIAITVKNIIVWASSDWLNIEIMDRILFLIISEIYSEGDYNEIPIYFSNTPLEDEGIGKIPYKFFVIKLLKETKILFLSDNDININSIDLNIFDDFFISRIIGMKNNLLFNNEIIDNNVKSLIVYNYYLKTYKIMIDESLENVFEKFIINNVFSNMIFIDEESENLTDEKSFITDEFYIKDDSNFTFYYYKINFLTFFILFDRETTFDDINIVKVTLKTLKENFDNKENYKDSKK